MTPVSEQNWTPSQQDAITARGGSVLVTAAAGSGKTAVLVERAIRILCDDENPVDADRILLLTFSNAAAAEMRQRISARLSRLIRENPSDYRLRRQQALLSCARISTIHSFCLDLIRQNFQNLPVSPDFSLADEAELAIMKADCAREVIGEFYEMPEKSAFLELVELLFVGRDDKKLVDVMLKIYDFCRSHPFYLNWLDDKLALYGPDAETSRSDWGQAIMSWAEQALAFCAGQTDLSLAAIAQDDAIEKAYGPALRSDKIGIAECARAVAGGDWDGAVRALESFAFEKLGPLRGVDTRKALVQESRKQVKELIGDLKAKYFSATEREFGEDLADLRPKIAVLFGMVRAFDQKFSEQKAAKRRLDFSDLEHLALLLLVRKTERGYERTAQAADIAERFEHVLVDEYQDTNEAQDLIFTCVSRGQQNLFMVGDVKQSIYRFRQAMPEIFMEKKQKFFPYGGGVFPAKIVLGANFRSREQVTGAVNDLFGLLMSSELGEIDYDREERLVCGAEYPAGSGLEPELLILADCGDDPVRSEAEAIAEKIRGMIAEGFPITENGAARPARPRDFCVLLRSTKNRAEHYAKALMSVGLPVAADTSGGFLSQREVAAMVGFLCALDNPLLDIELVSAMLSPFFDFTEDDVAGIRVRLRDAPLYSALCLAAEDDEKAAGFLRMFRELRSLAAILPASSLITVIYEKTGAAELARAMPMGGQREAALRQLVEYAAEYHRLGYKKLGGFVGFLNRLRERGGDLAAAGGGPGDGADAVRIMSVHRSKGLEFPVVILADAARRFNRADMREPALLHSRLGFACVRRDRENLKQFTTVPMQAVRLECEREALSEELRILYVALTRAKEKLIMSAAFRGDARKKLAGLVCGLESGKLPPFVVRQAQSFADWILMAVLHLDGASALRELGGIEDLETVPSGSRWQIMMEKPGEESEPAEAGRVFTHTADPALLEELRRRRDFVYPFLAHTSVPAKLAVSAAAKSGDGAGFRFRARPRFLTEHAGLPLSPAEQGSALHRFMQFADYAAARIDIENEIARMERREYLTAAEAASLDRRRLAGFFSSALAGRIFASGDVRRELKFMAECGREALGELFPDLPEGAAIALQGVADCVFFENGEAVIVDYKTDRAASPGELAEKYAGQLRLYRAILEQNLGVPVRECLIYSFAFSREIQIGF